MNRRILRVVSAAITLAPVINLAWSSIRIVGMTSAVPNTVVSRPLKTAPDFELQTLAGRVVRLSDFRGQALVLNFWATWCTPCRVETRWLSDFSARYKDKGLEVVGISLDDGNPQVVADFAREMKVNYLVLLGNQQVGDAYGGTRFLPQTFFITPEGKISATSVGIKTKDDFENSIRQLLKSEHQ